MAFVDLENAFPSVDRATLWVKLHEWGVRGPLMDWLRMLYFRLRYVVRCGGRISTAFQSFIGILIGDPASPHLWNLFMADFALKDDPDDITLNGRRISHMEQADDIVIFSTTREGLQRKLDELYRWCQLNFVTINADKTKCLVFNASRRTPPANCSLDSVAMGGIVWLE